MMAIPGKSRNITEKYFKSVELIRSMLVKEY